MGHIYTQAKEVFIWLGHEEEHTSSFVELVRELTPALIGAKRKYSIEDIQLLTSNNKCKGQLGVTDLLVKLSDFVLFTVLCRRFQRFWVVSRAPVRKTDPLFAE